VSGPNGTDGESCIWQFDPPKSIATDEDEKNDDSSNLRVDMEAFSPGHSVMTQETNFTLSSRVVRWRKASRAKDSL
jgi:hypothetical protein